MIAYLTGEILELGESSVILLAGGVGYEINITAADASAFEKGQNTSFFIAESISPYDGTMLYGFVSKEDKQLWNLFRDAIPNTGAKKAMELLNKALRSVADFHNAITKKDPKILTAIFGFTSKTADKLIHSLQDKIDAISVQGVAKIKTADEPYMAEVVAALSALGYTASESRMAMDKIYAQGVLPTEKTENIIRMALKVLKK